MTSVLGDGNSSFPDIIAALLKEGNTVQALTFFSDNKNSDEVRDNSWDLVPIVANYLTDECENNSIEVFKCCQKLITIIAQNSKPEEVLLQFIEEIETAEDDTKFLMLLKPLETVLLRVPDKRITSLGWCFNSIRSYLEKIETPEDLNLVEEERLLLDSNDIVNRIIYLYNELMPFCDIFVKELADVGKSGSFCERKQIVGKFLVELLGKPMSFLDMTVYKNTKSKARLIGEQIIEKVTFLYSDLFLFLEMRDGTHCSDLIKPNDLSLGVFYYLILSEEVCLESTPKVYSPVYILNNCLTFVNKLLTQEGQFVVEKGVDLAEVLLKSVDPQELSYLLLDSEHHVEFCKIISNNIVHNESQDVRKKSLEVLQTYLYAFEHQGRYLIVLNLIQNINHGGLKGHLITKYKEMLIQEIRGSGLENLSIFYKGRKLYNLLDQFTFLRNNEETDLVDESDQIVSTLNFLRYLVIVDNGEIGIDEYLKGLEDGYFKMLKTGIGISQEHYKLRIKEENEENRVKKKNENCKVSVTVSGKNLAELNSEKKVEIMNMSLTSLDVVDSLLSRLLECIKIRNGNL